MASSIRLHLLVVTFLIQLLYATNALIKDELIRSNNNGYRGNVRYSEYQPMYSNDNQFRKYTPRQHAQKREVPHRRHHIHNDHSYGYDPQYSAAMEMQNAYSVSTTSSSNDMSEYSEEHQFSAFMFSLFMGEFGLDRLYIGEYTIGTVKAC